MKYHVPVLVKEILELFEVKNEWYIDGTLGDGGHSLEILKNGGKVLGVDQDEEAIARAKERLGNLGEYRLVKGNFRDLDTILVREFGKLRGFDGILLDLGVSSYQLGTPERGFSFMREGVLDMRMDRNLGVSAKELVNGLNKEELEKLFLKYGEINDKRIAKAIVEARKAKFIETTWELARIVEKIWKRRPGDIHPATTVFQALRIAVNDELHSLKEGLIKGLMVLKPGGKLLVISFHSLEENVVRDQFGEWEKQGLGKSLGVVRPSLDEIYDNPRSRSAKLRIFEKL